MLGGENVEKGGHLEQRTWMVGGRGGGVGGKGERKGPHSERNGLRQGGPKKKILPLTLGVREEKNERLGHMKSSKLGLGKKGRVYAPFHYREGKGGVLRLDRGTKIVGVTAEEGQENPRGIDEGNPSGPSDRGTRKGLHYEGRLKASNREEIGKKSIFNN